MTAGRVPDEWVEAAAQAISDWYVRNSIPDDEDREIALDVLAALAPLVAAERDRAVRDARAAALIEAADEVHREARWQQECLMHSGIKPGATPDQKSVDRLLIVERLLRERAARIVADLRDGAR